MPVKGIDTYNSMMGYASDLKAQGISFVIRYYFTFSSFKQPFAAAEARHLSDNGIWCGAIYEGAGDHASYFTAAQGASDGNEAWQQAEAVGQPKGTTIYFAGDFDSTPEELFDYAEAFQGAVKPHGYMAGLYGNGVTCQALLDRGYIDRAWLSQSRGFAGYLQFAASGKANIEQGAAYKIKMSDGRVFDVDGDYAFGDSGCWKVQS